MNGIYIHQYPWLNGNEELLKSLLDAILAHSLETMADCVKLHQILVKEGGEATYGDADSTIKVLSDATLAEINSGHCYPKVTHGLWHRNHCGSFDHLFLWSDDGKAINSSLNRFLLQHPENHEEIGRLSKARRACFHIREWDSDHDDGEKDFKPMMCYGDCRDIGNILSLKFQHGEWETDLLPNISGHDPHLYIQIALSEHEQDEEVTNVEQ